MKEKHSIDEEEIFDEKAEWDEDYIVIDEKKKTDKKKSRRPYPRTKARHPDFYPEEE